MRRLPMRTTLLIALLALSFGLTVASLLVIRMTVRRQIEESLALDLSHSVSTFTNLQRQQRETLSRSSALVADLPSLKALMTTGDSKTIIDGGAEFWKVSGSDLFALSGPSGELMTEYVRGPGLNARDIQPVFNEGLEHVGQARTVEVGGRLFETIVQPLYFGSTESGTVLGYVAMGNAIDQRLAREVREASAAEVAFSAQGKVIVSTLPPGLEDRLSTAVGKTNQTNAGESIFLGSERYLVAVVPLTSATAGDNVKLIVLKSYDRASNFLMRVNRWVTAIGTLALLLGGLLAVSISWRVTRPLEGLVDGARALGRGDFSYGLGDGGTAEVVELREAFERMRAELLQSQRALLEAERLATIGRMASSISHDLRHYLSAMYANAEFLSLPETPQQEREELIAEVESAVHGMTDLLDSLLIFGQTGKPLNQRWEFIGGIIESAVGMLRAHPEARDVRIETGPIPKVRVLVDGKKLGRAIFNLMLNACQAASQGSGPPHVEVSVTTGESLCVRVADTGPGVPAAIRETMFDPFVSAEKASGVGLGLTLALHIAQEHGGTVKLEESTGTRTVFMIVLPIVSKTDDQVPTGSAAKVEAKQVG
jgi:signal transduction histidine kinase